MQYKMRTNQGLVFTLNGEGFDLKAYVSELNKRELVMVSVGGIVIQKRTITSIFPKREEGEKGEGVELSIVTNERNQETGEMLELTAYAREYDSEEQAAAFNQLQSEFVLVGDVIVQRNNANVIMEVAESK